MQTRTVFWIHWAQSNFLRSKQNSVKNRWMILPFHRATSANLILFNLCAVEALRCSSAKPLPIYLWISMLFPFVCIRIVCVFLSGLCAVRNVKIIAQQVVRIHLEINVDWRAHESSTRHGTYGTRTIYWFSMDDTSPSWPLSTKVLGVCVCFFLFSIYGARHSSVVSSRVECEWRHFIIACHIYLTQLPNSDGIYSKYGLFMEIIEIMETEKLFWF